MPPKKRKVKAKAKPTQRQSQRQSIVVNIGSTSKSKPRKSSGRGGLPPPSYAHNLAPTFVTAPQVDYTPLLAMIQHHSSPIVPQAPMPVQNPVTPLSSALATQTAEQMAGEVAVRRAGPTAANFQVPSSEARMRVEPEPSGILSSLTKVRPQPSVPKTSLKERKSMAAEDIDVPLMISSEPKGKPVTFIPTQKKERKDFKPITKYSKPIDHKPIAETPTPENFDQLPSQREFKSTEVVRARAKQQTLERAKRIETIRAKMAKDLTSVTREDKLFLARTKGTKRLQEALGIEGLF